MADLSARSVIASTLLGTVPPRLPGRLLVAFTSEFGIQPGTTRTALSRMVDRGELAHLPGGEYELAGDLLGRHLHQEAGLRAATRPWQGEWDLHVVRPGARPSADRGALRRACGHLGLGERRDGVWMRPANLDPDRLPAARAIVAAQTEAYVATPGGDAADLLAELYDLGAWAGRADELLGELDESGPRLASELVDGFLLAASTLRHLVADPLVPVELEPPGWPARRLRAAYGAFVAAYQASLRSFFRAQLASG